MNYDMSRAEAIEKKLVIDSKVYPNVAYEANTLFPDQRREYAVPTEHEEQLFVLQRSFKEIGEAAKKAAISIGKAYYNYQIQHKNKK